MINGENVLEHDELGGQVVKSSLTSVGTLATLNVDRLKFCPSGDPITIESLDIVLHIKSAGAINLTTSQEITGVAEPTTNTSVATKYYVDDQINLEPVIMNLDVTGLSSTEIASIIQDIYPANNKRPGSYAYIITSSLTGATVSGINVDTPVLTKSLIAVDSNGVQNESVLQDIAFTAASGTVNITIQRGLKRFQTVGSPGSLVWQFESNINSTHVPPLW